MSNLRNFIDYLWPAVGIPHDAPSYSSSSNSPRDDQDSMSTSPQSQPQPMGRRQRHDRRRKDDGIEQTHSRAATLAGGERLSAIREGGENIELQPVRLHKRRGGDDGSPGARGFHQRIRDLEASNAEQRKLADDRQHRIRVLEKENVDLKSQTESVLKRLQALQSANSSFISNISNLERELHTLKVQHFPCANRIFSAETKYSALLSAHAVLQSTYNDVRSSHQALQSSCTTLQMSHSALLFSHSTPLLQHPLPVIVESPPSPLQSQPQLPRLEIYPPMLSRESSVQTSSSPVSAAPSNTGSDVSRLKTLLNDRTSELTSLQTFLSKHDKWSGAQVVQAVKDLNGEIARLAAAVSEHFVNGTSGGIWDVGGPQPSEKPLDDEVQPLLREALGSKFYTLVARSGSSSDPSLMIQYVIQAWQIWICAQILDKFCFGLPDEVDDLLSDVWEAMRAQELQPMSSRWRGLAHGYLRTSLQAAAPKTTQLPTPPASPYLAAIQNPRSLLFKQERDLLDLNLKGLRSILNLAGGDAMKLEEEFGEAVKRIQEQAMNIATVTREGVMSGWFELVRVPGVVNPLSPADVPSIAIGSGKSRRGGKGKGKVNRGKQALTIATKYDEEQMENVFKGFGREEGAVMSTVEFGLVCVKKDDTDGFESPFADLESRVEDAAAAGPAQVLERRLLLKPKVLLESVEEIL